MQSAVEGRGQPGQGPGQGGGGTLAILYGEEPFDILVILDLLVFG